MSKISDLQELVNSFRDAIPSLTNDIIQQTADTLVEEVRNAKINKAQRKALLGRLFYLVKNGVTFKINNYPIMGLVKNDADHPVIFGRVMPIIHNANEDVYLGFDEEPELKIA